MKKTTFFTFLFVFCSFFYLFGQKNIDADKDSTIYTILVKSPKFKGGQDSLNIWLLQNVKYPKRLKKSTERGLVEMEIIVEKDGRLTSPKIIKSVHPLIDKEAIRVVNKMPNWIPGINEKGRICRSYLYFAIAFSPENSK